MTLDDIRQRWEKSMAAPGAPGHRQRCQDIEYLLKRVELAEAVITKYPSGCKCGECGRWREVAKP